MVSYTDDQVKLGAAIYKESCANCHGATLGGDGETPGLIGSGFRDRWFSETADVPFSFISTEMPGDDPGALEAEQYE